MVGASPVGTAPTTSSFSTQHLASMDCPKATARRDESLTLSNLVRPISEFLPYILQNTLFAVLNNVQSFYSSSDFYFAYFEQSNIQRTYSNCKGLLNKMLLNISSGMLL